MKVITSVVNNPIFIMLQYMTLRHYMKCPYEYIVFNDAKEFPDITNNGNIKIKQEIRDTCSQFKIQCIDIPNAHHQHVPNMSGRHAETFTKHVLRYQKEHPDKYLLIDSDMFLFDYFDTDLYDQYDCAFVPQYRDDMIYMWPGFCYLDFTKITNVDLLSWDGSPRCDSGGMTQFWLKTQKNPYKIMHLWSLNWSEESFTDVKTVKADGNILTLTQLSDPTQPGPPGTNAGGPINISINLLNFCKKDPRNKERPGKYFCEIYDQKFLHYRAGSNWLNEGMDLHMKLSKQLYDVMTGDILLDSATD